jgi:tetratricopeptide (TPR) repeat protein
MLKSFFYLNLLFLVLSGTALAASSPWVEVRSEHFTVLTDSGQKEGIQLVDQFERMRWVFSVLFPKSAAETDQPIIVLAVHGQKSFEALEPAAYLAKKQIQLAGLFLRAPDKNYILLRLDAEFDHPYASVFHEYTHFQFSKSGIWIPLWLNEGMAEFFQNTEFRDKDVLLGEPSVDDLLYLRDHTLIPLPVLFKVDGNSPYYHEEQKGSVFYAESWALVHYLQITDRQKNLHRLHDYLALIGKDVDAQTAAEQAFGDLRQLQKELEGYIHAASFMQFKLSSAAAKIDEKSFRIRTLTPTETDARRADVLAYVRRTDDARTLATAVLKTDPQNALAHETMGFLTMQEGRLDEARRWYQQAVQLDSQSYLACYHYATLSQGAGGDDAEIEASLRTAIRLNPHFAPAYDQLAALFMRQQKNLEEARTLNIHAIQLEPTNIPLRMNAASILIAMEHFKDAEEVLRTALKMASKPFDIEMVQERLSELKQLRQLQQENAQTAASVQNQEQGEAVGVVGVVAMAPKHPTMPTDGVRHVAEGVIRKVACSYPSIIEFQLEGTKKTVTVYNNDMFRIDLSVDAGAARRSMNPCTDFEGETTKIEYVDSTDKTVDGEVVSVLLRR